MSAGDWAAARGSGATGVSCRAAYVFNGINGIYACNVIYGLYDSKGISRRAVMGCRGRSSCAAILCVWFENQHLNVGHTTQGSYPAPSNTFTSRAPVLYP